jgi:hypothetical protein
MCTAKQAACPTLLPTRIDGLSISPLSYMPQQADTSGLSGGSDEARAHRRRVQLCCARHGEQRAGSPQHHREGSRRGSGLGPRDRPALRAYVSQEPLGRGQHPAGYCLWLRPPTQVLYSLACRRAAGHSSFLPKASQSHGACSSRLRSPGSVPCEGLGRAHVQVCKCPAFRAISTTRQPGKPGVRPYASFRQIFAGA